jgi:ankyrin repeat protein
MKKFLLVVLMFVATRQLNAQNNDELITASVKGDLATVKKNIEGGANVNYLNAQGQTPISVAFFFPDVTEYLLSKGADANGGDSPSLTMAPRFYSVEVMKLLLKAGADPNKPAVVKVDLAAPIRKLLEEEKAKGKKGNKYMVKAYEDQLSKMPAGNTMTTYALQAAVESTNCEECVMLLLKAGAKDFKSQISGGNAMHQFATSYVAPDVRQAGITPSIPYFEKAGMGIPDWYRNINLVEMGDAYGIAKLLKEAGIDMEALDNQKQTPLKAAMNHPTPNEDVIMSLVNNGASIKATGMNLDKTAFASETEDPEKIKVKFDFPGEGRNSNGSGYSANMDLLNPKPKRIALVSFYLYDAGKGKANITGVGAWRTPDYEGQAQINGFYSKSIGKLKETFKENGMELLTPNEFLDTEEKAEYYYGFEQESAKKEKTTLTRSKTRSSSYTGGGWTTTTYTTTTSTVGTLKVCPYGQGYRSFFVANEAEDESQINNFQGGIMTANRKLTSNLGYDLAKALGVDAVLVVYIATRKPKQMQDDYAVNAVVAVMLGPNPGRSASADPEAKNLGQFYCGTRTLYGSPLVFKEKKGVFGQYDGMANVLAAHARKMSKYINGKEKDSE